MKKTLLFLLIAFSFTIAKAQYKHDSIKIEHGYLHYYTKGEGEPLILLQGGPGFSSFYMRAIADSLDGYKTVLVDFEGTGRSQYRKADPTWVSMDNLVGNVELVRKKLGMNNWTAIGHSYGGMFALYYAVKHPEIVSKVISVSGAGTDNKFQQYYTTNIMSRFTPEDMKKMAEIRSSTTLTETEKSIQEVLVMTPAIFYDRSKAPRFMNNIPPDEMKMVMNGDYFQSMFIELNKLDFGKDVYQLNTPIRIIQGRQDAIGEAVPVLLNERSKDSKLFFVERSAHAPWAEQPEIFFKVLKDFLIN